MYKTALFYFSATGNSLYTAKEISKGWTDVELISIPDALHSGCLAFDEYDVVGIVTPLYFMGLPPIVKTFLSQITLRNVKYCFSIITRAFSRGYAFHQINRLLNQKGLELNYAQYLNYPDNYIRWAEAADEKKQHKQFKESEQKLLGYKKQVEEQIKNYKKEGFILKAGSSVVYHIWKSRLRYSGSHFKVSQVCNNCGICEKACPTQNISIINKVPHWHTHCVDCMGCIQHCPKKAIYFNKRTEKRRRYRNPHISLHELLHNRTKEEQ